MNSAEIEIKMHGPTGLVMAVSKDLPGFVVHAHSMEEMRAKIADSFTDFMAMAHKTAVQDVTVTELNQWMPVHARADYRKAA